jgi:hypothetical protein
MILPIFINNKVELITKFFLGENMKKIFIPLIALLAITNTLAQLPTGLQTFQNATGSGTLTVTSVGGYFVLTAVTGGSGVNVNADQYGAFVQNSSANVVTTYFEVKAAGDLGSFEISTATIGTYYYSGGGVDHFTNVYVTGYLNNTLVVQTTPVNSITGTWQANFPIDYAPFSGKRIDLFRVYYTKETDAYEENFNFQDFTVANSSSISVATNSASSITTTGATLNGTVDANGTNTTVTFDYGTTPSYGTTVTADQSPLSGSGAVAVFKAITGLSPGILYHYRAVGVSNSVATNGEDQTFATLYTTPSTQVTSILLPSTADGTQLNVSWTNGNGTNRAVFMKQGTGVITNPSNNTTYTASANWNSKGTQLGSSGYYCIYTGTGNSISVTNTTGNTEYTIQAFEYNGTSGSEQYNTGTSTGNPHTQTSLPVELTSFIASIEENSVKLNWSTITEVNNYGFYVERRKENEQNFYEVKDGFIPGHGSTLEPQSYSFVDNTITEVGTYYYRLRQVDNDGLLNYSSPISVTISTLGVDEQLPLTYKLEQNYPNPFNPVTTIKYSLPSKSFVSLKVYNLLGNEVATLVNSYQDEGYKNVKFDGSNLSSGIYIYKIKAGNYSEVKRMLLVR